MRAAHSSQGRCRTGLVLTIANTSAFRPRVPASLASLRCANRSKADTTVAMTKLANVHPVDIWARIHRMWRMRGPPLLGVQEQVILIAELREERPRVPENYSRMSS